MANQQQKATLRLRELILAGDFAPGEWLREHMVSKKLGTSRTPARIAMQILEQEGLLRFYPNRGFCVERFTLQQIADAVDVRGTLEAMACRLVAQNGLSKETEEALRECVARGRELVGGSGFGEEHTQKWSGFNRDFHDRIVRAAGNEALSTSIEYNNRIPLASAGAITFFSQRADLGLPMLREAQRDHEQILDAIVDRDSGRAEYLMREHGRRSRENKLMFMNDVKSRAILDTMPGSKLIIA